MNKESYFKKREIDIDKWIGRFDKVQTWLAKLQDKSQNAYNLYRYCEWSNKNPNELLVLKKESNDNEAEYLLDKFVADDSLGLTDHARNNVVMAVRSFYRHNYADLAREAGKISPQKVKPTRKPTKENIRKLWNAAYNPRDRCFVSFVAATAIARESLLHVKFSYLEEDWKNQEIPHISLPDKIIKGHGKGRYKDVRQETFLTPQAKQDLIEYIEWMEQNRDFTFKNDSHIFLRVKSPYKPLSYSQIGMIATRLSEKSGVPFSWHDMRRFVETALEEARVHPNWCRKIRGRKVKGEEAPYSQPKIEQLREAYRSALPYLSFSEVGRMEKLERNGTAKDQRIKELEKIVMMLALQRITEEGNIVTKEDIDITELTKLLDTIRKKKG